MCQKKDMAGRKENAEFAPEQMLPLIAKLADKYTSKESSSVPYETAAMLTEAVAYTLREGLEDGDRLGGGVRGSGDAGDSESTQGSKEAQGNCVLKVQGEKTHDIYVIYEHGKEVIRQKVYWAKALYEKLSVEFEDYGCLNYRDTVMKGMPAFFVKYDPLFAPQDHILTMDYPLLCEHMAGRSEPLTGVDRILDFLEGVTAEAEFLELSATRAVTECVRRDGFYGDTAEQGMSIDYPKWYMGNLCQPVLWQAVCCMIADRPVGNLTLEDGDRDVVKGFFEGDSRDKAEEKISRLIGVLLQKAEKARLAPYFQAVAPEYAARVASGLFA